MSILSHAMIGTGVGSVAGVIYSGYLSGESKRYHKDMKRSDENNNMVGVVIEGSISAISEMLSIVAVVAGPVAGAGLGCCTYGVKRLLNAPKPIQMRALMVAGTVAASAFTYVGTKEAYKRAYKLGEKD